ncbi:hypothetical protein FRB94_000051 [Tulasnella sp. JGI-2019a]|nr:hypothetical protein FRB94_000051 [Tulasnella sp. JGI-2019a]KAG9039631.1 hypothetical protein FRB95_009212 [Tulasnella sp. JGI-2019a]
MLIPTIPAAGLLLMSVSIYVASSAVAPTAPGPGSTFDEGSMCTVEWEVDTTGEWKDMTIDLMSGSDLNMTRVLNVASVVDGTNPTLTPFSWTCPPVCPNSDIYFYQLSQGHNRTLPTWTARFTIASRNGSSTPAPYGSQPNGGLPIPWGYGVIHDTASSWALDNTAASDSDTAIITPGEVDSGDDIEGDDDVNVEGSDDSEDEFGEGPPDIISKSSDSGVTSAQSTLGAALKSDTLANFTVPTDNSLVNANMTATEANPSANDTTIDIPVPVSSDRTSGAKSYGGAQDRDALVAELVTCVAMCITLCMAVIG